MGPKVSRSSRNPPPPVKERTNWNEAAAVEEAGTRSKRRADAIFVKIAIASSENRQPPETLQNMIQIEAQQDIYVARGVETWLHFAQNSSYHTAEPLMIQPKGYGKNSRLGLSKIRVSH